MPNVEESGSHVRAAADPIARAYESLTPFETVLVDSMGKLHESLLEEFRGLRRDIIRVVLGVGAGGFVVVLVLVFGLLATRGVDVQGVADATKTAANIVTTTTTETETEVVSPPRNARTADPQEPVPASGE